MMSLEKARLSGALTKTCIPAICRSRVFIRQKYKSPRTSLRAESTIAESNPYIIMLINNCNNPNWIHFLLP